MYKQYLIFTEMLVTMRSLNYNSHPLPEIDPQKIRLRISYFLIGNFRYINYIDKIYNT